jgi:excisionase family DNA binding protein
MRTSHNPRVSIRELAALLRVSTDTIRRAYRRGDLPAMRRERRTPTAHRGPAPA